MTEKEIADVEQRRVIETLRSRTEEKIKRIDERLVVTNDLKERVGLLAERKEAEDNVVRYSAQISALDKKQPIGALRHERALVERELALNEGPVTKQSHKQSMEALGEIGASNAMREHPELRERYKDYYLVTGFERRTSTGVDQVWRNKDGDHLIVEAKGGTHAKLGDGQMAKAWAISRAESLAIDKDSRYSDAGKALLAARDSKKLKLEGVTVHQKDAATPAVLVRAPESPTRIQNYKAEPIPTPSKSKKR